MGLSIKGEALMREIQLETVTSLIDQALNQTYEASPSPDSGVSDNDHCFWSRHGPPERDMAAIASHTSAGASRLLLPTRQKRRDYRAEVNAGSQLRMDAPHDLTGLAVRLPYRPRHDTHPRRRSRQHG